MTDLLNKLTWFINQLIRYLLFPGESQNWQYTIFALIKESPILMLFACMPFVVMIIYIFRRLIKIV